MWVNLLFGCLLLQAINGEPPPPSYVVVIPAVILHPSSEKVCSYISEPTHFTMQVTLKSKGREDILLLKRDAGPESSECASFQVPPPSQGSEEVVTIEVLIDLDGSRQFSETKKVLLKLSGKGTFVQTDKPIYKAEDTVRFRIVSFDKNFVAINDKYPLIEILDPKGNCIGQFHDATPEQGILDLFYPLSSEPVGGTYRIKVKSPLAEQTFEVKEYVLPKFEVTVVLPSDLTSTNEHVNMSVCGRYTYGKPVKGTAQAKVCQRAYSYRSDDICSTFNGKTDSNGCFNIKTDTRRFELHSKDYYSNLEAEAHITEDGTGVQLNASGSCTISRIRAKVSFEDVAPHYKPGMLYRGVMKLVGPNGAPWPGEDLLLSVNDLLRSEVYNLSTDQSGRAAFALNTSSWGAISISLKGQYRDAELLGDWGSYQDAHKTVMRFWEDGNSYLSIKPQNGLLACGQEKEVTVDFTLDPSDVEENSHQLQFNYLVVARGAIILHGQETQTVSKAVQTGSFHIRLPITADMAPSATLLCYVSLPNERIAADSIKIAIDKCFQNKVTLEFSEQQTLPGSDVTLQLEAAPGSLCSIHAVDKSISLMKADSEISSSTVYGLLSFLNQGGYPHHVAENRRPCRPVRPHPRMKRSVRPNRRRPWPPFRGQDQPDAFSIFKDAGLKIWTNLNVRQPEDCHIAIPKRHAKSKLMRKANSKAEWPMVARLDDQFDELLTEGSMDEMVHEHIDEHGHSEKIRTDFPETWLWDLQTTGPTGKKSMSVTAPDTITEWNANSFCMADIGFGLSPVATLVTFKPFFVDLTLPYSVIRGEGFALKATIFSYEKECMAVQVTLNESKDFKVESQEETLHSCCLCANEVKTFTWDIKPTALGKVNITVSAEAVANSIVCGENSYTTVPRSGSKDTLRKVLLVQAEGILEEKTHRALMCNTASEKFYLELPANVAMDSERAYTSVTGDIMGTAMNNIDKLLAMPYGCGEQNMINFAPNVCIWHYLEKTGQMTEDIKAKTTKFLTSGYQRQLNYKHDDGSYSAFGKSDSSGNTWLTAFVAKCFGQAKQYIYIEERHIEDAVRWLKKNQQPNGCFKSVGRLLDNALKGGVNDEVSLSAYITITLLELQMKESNPVLQKALQCLESSDSTSSTLYTKALLALAFTLVGNTERRWQLLEELDKRAIKSDNEMYWTETPQEAEKKDFWSKPNSVDVELTSYVLTALVSGKNVSNDNKKTSVSIVKWLTRQQNANGGFSSTQDTMVALQALSRYGELTYSPTGKVTVSVKSDKGFQHTFDVESRNRLLLQQENLPELPGEYTAFSSGQGCAYVQTTLRYNVPPPKSVAAFSLNVSTRPKDCVDKSHTCFTVNIQISYTGNRVSTNMVLVAVNMLSGFLAQKDTVTELAKFTLVKRTEISDSGTVTIYLDEVPRQTQEYSFSIKQEIPVTNQQPATVEAYDYYQNEERTMVEYVVHGSSGTQKSEHFLQT